MTPKQQRFLNEYLKDSNATQAAIRAGYSPKTAGQQAHMLLKNLEISAAIKDKAEKVGMSADEVLSGLAGIARGEVKDTKPSDRVSAFGLLGKFHKLFTDKVEHSGNVTITVVDPYAEAPGK